MLRQDLIVGRDADVDEEHVHPGSGQSIPRPHPPFCQSCQKWENTSERACVPARVATRRGWPDGGCRTRPCTVGRSRC